MSRLLPLYFILIFASVVTGQYANTTTKPTISYLDPTGVSTSYATTTYNQSLASTYLPQTDFSNERLALLWDQVGPVVTGPITTTVSPTSEPSKYASPGMFHPYVPSYESDLANARLPENFIWGVASSAYQVEVSQSAFLVQLYNMFMRKTGSCGRRR